jgi:hypothetical protein
MNANSSASSLLKSLQTAAFELLWLALLLAAAPGADAVEIVVAIRYLQAEGISHSQLFLFREDGTLLRQLTDERAGQVKRPVFGPAGKSIIFTRVVRAGKSEYWSVDPKEGNLRRLKRAPAWYAAAESSDYFETPNAPARDDSGAYTTPDGAQRLTTTDAEDGDDCCKTFVVQNVKTGESVKLENKPEEFEAPMGVMTSHQHAKRVFLTTSPLRVVFFWNHLNSTDGETTHALDLNTLRLVRLSPNWAAPFPLPSEPAFLTYTEERYRPLSELNKSANCSYIDRWNDKLERIRYGRDVPAVCYGASMYRPGGKPSTITIFCRDVGTPDGAPLSGF